MLASVKTGWDLSPYLTTSVSVHTSNSACKLLQVVTGTESFAVVRDYKVGLTRECGAELKGLTDRATGRANTSGLSHLSYALPD